MSRSFESRLFFINRGHSEIDGRMGGLRTQVSTASVTRKKEKKKMREMDSKNEFLLFTISRIVGRSSFSTFAVRPMNGHAGTQFFPDKKRKTKRAGSFLHKQGPGTETRRHRGKTPPPRSALPTAKEGAGRAEARPPPPPTDGLLPSYSFLPSHRAGCDTHLKSVPGNRGRPLEAVQHALNTA